MSAVYLFRSQTYESPFRSMSLIFPLIRLASACGRLWDVCCSVTMGAAQNTSEGQSPPKCSRVQTRQLRRGQAAVAHQSQTGGILWGRWRGRERGNRQTQQAITTVSTQQRDKAPLHQPRGCWSWHSHCSSLLWFSFVSFFLLRPFML